MSVTEYCLAMVSVGDAKEASTIADALVAEKLAACVQIMPIQSVYVWEGQVERDSESLLLAKTKRHLFEQLQNRVKSLHSYDTPEVIAFDVAAGAEKYLGWIDTVLQ